MLMAPSFNNLPFELIQNIVDYLPPSARVSLRLAAKDFHQRVENNRNDNVQFLSRCEYRALERNTSERNRSKSVFLNQSVGSRRSG